MAASTPTSFEAKPKQGGAPSIASLHASLGEDIRGKRWYSNCAGEVFVDSGKHGRLRIGYFQGDAALAAFVVAAHEAARKGTLGAA